MPRSVAQQWLTNGMIALGLGGLVVACSPMANPIGPTSLNSRYTDEQPALSGNGRFLAFVSNRNGIRRILLYDIPKRQYIYLPGLNRQGAIAESPSLSYTARYIVYIIDDRGRPVVALYDRLTQQSQALTRFYQGAVRHPSISPDGRYILFESGRRGQWDIEVIDRGPNIELDRPEQGSGGAGEQGGK
jgi:Tol biopolymer transport system component